jgi:hypothetical protein
MIACALLPLGGCGRSDRPPIGQVQGTVLLRGKPLASADVVFRPVKGRVSYATTDANGHYDLIYLRQDHGAIVGMHKVQIFTQSPGNVRKEIVPACYNSKSTLQKEVVAGKNEINFDLK